MFRLVCLTLTLALFWPGSSPCFAESLRINTSIKPPFSTEDQSGFFDQLLREMFHRVGKTVEIVRMPTERSLQSVNGGESDGDLPRIDGLEASYPNLIRVDEPVIVYAFSAFTNSGECRDISWERLKGQRVGIIIGWKIYEATTPIEAQRTMFTDPESMLRSLDAGRIDLALYERFAGRYLATSLELPRIGECFPPLAEKPMYLYLNTSHADLLAPLKEAIRSMKSDGSYERISKETLDTLRR